MSGTGLGKCLCGIPHCVSKLGMGVLSKVPKLLCMHLQRRDDEISQCTKSVRCDHNMHRMDDAVVDIYAINLQLGAMAVCTGDTFPSTLCRCACMPYAPQVSLDLHICKSAFLYVAHLCSHLHQVDTPLSACNMLQGP